MNQRQNNLNMQKNGKTEKVIQSVKSIGEAEPNPYLFNKIMHRLKDRAEETYVKHPVLVWTSMSVLTLLIAVNIYVLLSSGSGESADDLNSVAGAYGLNDQGGLNYE